ncbi:uncharacterized protein BJ212DRAFT_1258179, partial [Suillus subaureus]
HHSVQCYIIGMIAGAAPANFISAIHALTEFRYLTQALHFTDKQVVELDCCFKAFHWLKHSIVDARCSLGEKGQG